MTKILPPCIINMVTCPNRASFCLLVIIQGGRQDEKFLAVLLSFVLIYLGHHRFRRYKREPEFYTLNLDKLYEEGALPEEGDIYI